VGLVPAERDTAAAAALKWDEVDVLLFMGSMCVVPAGETASGGRLCMNEAVVAVVLLGALFSLLLLLAACVAECVAGGAVPAMALVGEVTLSVKAIWKEVAVVGEATGDGEKLGEDAWPPQPE